MYCLIVDDDELTRRLLERILVTAGHTVCMAWDGPGALTQLRKERPDLLLLDIGLPGMSGIEVMRQKLRDPSIAAIPTIVVSGWAPSDIREMETRHPMSMVQVIIGKPVVGDDLLKAISHIDGLKKLENP